MGEVLCLCVVFDLILRTTEESNDCDYPQLVNEENEAELLESG